MNCNGLLSSITGVQREKKDLGSGVIQCVDIVYMCINMVFVFSRITLSYRLRLSELIELVRGSVTRPP